MHHETPEIAALLDEVGSGDETALRRLLERHCDRLRRLIAGRLDRRLAGRLDASDIVQESLADAARKLDGYLDERPLPFFPWLRRLAVERLAQAHRDHLACQKRSVRREAASGLPPTAGRPDERATVGQSTPSAHIGREERRRLVRDAMEGLPPADREVLALRYLEGLRFGQIAQRLGQTERAVKVRHFRALGRLRDRLGSVAGESFG